MRFVVFFSTDTPQTSISPSVVNLGDVVTMTCSVTFGGPQNDPTYVMPDQFPQLSMMLGQENFNTHAPLNYTPGYPVRAQHRMIRVSSPLIIV